MIVPVDHGRGLLPAVRPSPIPAIAYLGGSVTAQKNDGYRSLLHPALRESLGRLARPISAGMGGMGAVAGLFFLDDLVLRHGPELCFVEFATTDMVGKTPAPRLEAVLEALVKRLREGECEPVFLLLGRLDHEATEQVRVVATYHRVAEAHGVLCIDLADEIGSDGSVFRDHVHTSGKGAALIAERVAEEIGPAVPPLGPPVKPTAEPDFTEARLVPARLGQLTDPASGETGQLGNVFEYVRAWPGNEFRVEFEGELIGIAAAVGPTSGGVRTIVGGGAEEASESRCLWDYMCHYERLDTKIFRPAKPTGTPVRIQPFVDDIDYRVAFEPPEDPANIVQDMALIAYMVRP